MEAVYEADSDSDAETYPHAFIGEESGRRARHFQRQLNNGIAQFFHFRPLPADQRIDAQRNAGQNDSETTPPHHRPKPRLYMLYSVEGRLAQIVVSQYGLIAYRKPLGYVRPDKLSSFIFRGGKPEHGTHLRDQYH